MVTYVAPARHDPASKTHTGSRVYQGCNLGTDLTPRCRGEAIKRVYRRRAQSNRGRDSRERDDCAVDSIPHNRRDGLDGAHDLHTYAGAEVKMETAYRREEMCRRSFKRTASPAIGVRTFLQ